MDLHAAPPMRPKRQRLTPLALGLLALVGAAGAPRSAEADPVVSLSLVGDWQIRVSLSVSSFGTAHSTQALTATLDVPPAPLLTVASERYASLPLFNPNTGGWAKGAALLGVRAQECTTLHLLDPESLQVRSGPEPDARLLAAGKDYGVDLAWGTFGRLTSGVLQEGQPVFASYRHGLLRLDSIVLTRDGRLVLRPGEPRSAAPRAPGVAEGERRLANVWLPGRIHKLAPEHLFPVLESAFPEPPAETPTPAEVYLPRTMEKLREGRPLRILAWGDSVTVGTYLPDPAGERWQEQFVARLRERFPKASIELVTEAWGGRNTSSYLSEPPGSEHHYGTKVLACHPDLVVSEFVNDAGLSAEQVEPHYARLLGDFQAIGAEWIILTPHYVRPDWMGLTRERDIDDDPRPYVRGLRQFATKYQVALADAARRYGRLWRQGIPYSTLMLNSINHPDVRGLRIFVESLMALFPGGSTGPTAEWHFNRDSDLEGWRPNAHLADTRVAGGALHTRGAGPDPILEYEPHLGLPASAWAVVEIRLQADHDGTAELFWSNTSEGRFGGFSQEKSLRFPVQGDRAWHTYRLRPFWHPEGRIVRLRFDLYDAARFEVDSLRVIEPSVTLASTDANFDFGEGNAGWRGEEGARVISDQGALAVTLHERRGFAAAPPVDIDAGQQTCVSLRMAVDHGYHATLLFATADRSGLRCFSFPIRADGREHNYPLDLLASPDWRGRVIALALRPSDNPAATARLRWLRAADAPQGEPEVEVRSLALEEFPARATRPLTLGAVVENTGGTSVSNLTAELRLPPDVRVLHPQATDLSRLAPGEDVTFRWSVEASRPLDGEVAVTLRCANAPRTVATAPVRFTPLVRAGRRDYVPEPKPVRGPFEVGAYYFPGWQTASQWQPIRRFPERRPVLGWYREGDPEVADWHIKWAVEHGITFFIYDWYWSRGSRQLEHALHEGYFKARYRSRLRFCLLWANHNPPGSSSLEDCANVARFWIEHYFRRAEHVTIDGKPLMIVFAPQRLSEDLGTKNVRAALDTMRAECVGAGLKGLYLAACVGDAAQARQAAAEGYDAVTAYTWPHLGVPAGEFRAPFAAILEGYRRNWEHLVDTAGIPLLPPLCGGWDSRPWHGENNYVRFDRTPDLFRQHLLDARHLLETRPGDPRLRNWLIIEAWNEWGEGAYLEPHREFGFGYLDALRAALTDAAGAHDDAAPIDLGRGPYDVATADPHQTAWEFDRDDEGWHGLMHVGEARVAEGALNVRTKAVDPAIVSPPLELRAADFRTVRFRLRLTAETSAGGADHGQVYWSTERIAESAATGVGFDVLVDGQWHELAVAVAQNPRWRGRITRLRLDPGERAGVHVEVDWVRLVP